MSLNNEEDRRYRSRSSLPTSTKQQNKTGGISSRGCMRYNVTACACRCRKVRRRRLRKTRTRNSCSKKRATRKEEESETYLDRIASFVNRSLGLLKDRGGFFIRKDFKMTDEAVLES